MDEIVDQFAQPRRACVIGASGGIGGALVRALARRGVEVHAGSRSGRGPQGEGIVSFSCDIADEASLAAAADTIGAPLDLLIVASGILAPADSAGPEKDWKAIDGATMAAMFAVNTIGPALVAKHFLPLLSGDRASVFAALSARVGSIGDNRLGGWYSYRASKAALNMLIRTLAIEARRKNPAAILTALHPGTVDTGLSRPFQRALPKGQVTTPDEAAEKLLEVIGTLRAADSGSFRGWDGQPIDW